MPTVRVETNLSANFFPNDFMPLFLIFLAETLGKDKNLMKFVFDTGVGKKQSKQTKQTKQTTWLNMISMLHAS